MKHLVLATLLLAAAAAPVHAQPDTKGFSLGLAFHTSHIGAEDPDPAAPPEPVYIDETGGGVSLLVGYGFTRSFVLRLALGVAGHDTTDPDFEFLYSSAVFEAAYLFRAGQPLRPYVLGGFGGFSVRSRQNALDFETTGPGVVAGAGLHYFLAERFALEFGLRADFMNWDTQRATLTFPNGAVAVVETPVDEGGTAAKFLFGGSFWF